MMATERDQHDADTAARRATARRTALVLGLTALGLYILFILKGVFGA
ncbi:MAG TPA: hypothetical protein PKZ76_10225 [Xanthomonadaceae bacterium]|nr:hypothetical protein [Xanthomonadaceae bacterium]